MNGIPKFSEFLKEDRSKSCFVSYTGKGWADGIYVGGPCRWRDDPDAFSGFSGPTAAVLPDVPFPRSKADADAAFAAAARESRTVSVPGFGDVVVGKRGLEHGVRYYSKSSRPNARERLNYKAAMAVADVLRGAAPRQFRPADESDRGKPIKGIVVLEGAVKEGEDSPVRPVRITVFVSAVCDFDRESDWEVRELYTLHSLHVLDPGADVTDF